MIIICKNRIKLPKFVNFDEWNCFVILACFFNYFLTFLAVFMLMCCCILWMKVFLGIFFLDKKRILLHIHFSDCSVDSWLERERKISFLKAYAKYIYIYMTSAVVYWKCCTLSCNNIYNKCIWKRLPVCYFFLYSCVFCALHDWNGIQNTNRTCTRIKISSKKLILFFLRIYECPGNRYPFYKSNFKIRDKFCFYFETLYTYSLIFL